MHRVAYRVSNGERITLDPNKERGKGGEAYIIQISRSEVAKIFMDSNDPAFATSPDLQKAASEKLDVHQRKLREFPFSLLPKRVVVPLDLLTDSGGRKIIGYTMEYLTGVETLLQYSDKDFREKGGISGNIILDLFLDLHPTVKQTHEKAGVVISDFNNLNVLKQGQTARVVDADSMGNAKYLSRMFTAFYVDPRLCDPKLTHMMLVKPHDFLSDWYAYEAMLMEALLFTRPWGGIYKPKDKKKKVPLDARPLHSISVFNSEVVYPKPALPLKTLPDDILDHMFLTFEKGKRGEFPIGLLKNMRYGKCPNCGLEHARSQCPNCQTATVTKKMTQVRGSVRADYVFQTRGVIVSATVHNGRLKFVYHDGHKFFREDGSVVLEGDLDSAIRYRMIGDKTILAKNGQMHILERGRLLDSISVDSFGSLPLIDTNSKHIYWSYGGFLYRDENYGPEVIGSVLDSQTMFWVGEDFGFGFYTAGNITRAFVFNADRSGIDDTVSVVPLKGQLVDSTCVFSGKRAWFMTSEKIGSKFVNRVQVINASGEVEAVYEAGRNDGSWLGKIRGKLPVGNFILSSTDDGMVRAEIDSGHIILSKEFPDTEPYLDEDSFLLAGGDGVLVVRKSEIINLKIK